MTRTRASLLITLLLLALSIPARASIGLVVGEPFGAFGTMMPAGHASIYLDHLCADTPTHLRLCHPGEHGVVIARYHDLHATNRDWLATPAIAFFYGVDDLAQTPSFVTTSTRDHIREQYRQAHLLAEVPDRFDRHHQPVPPSPGDWSESIGAAFDRRLLLYSIETTPQQDAALLDLLNADPNHRRYSLFHANCADFAMNLLNIVLPHTFHPNDIGDLWMTSPKQLAGTLVTYSARHPETHLSIYEIPQIPGTPRRSRPIRGGAETLLKTKRYLATLLVLQPELVLTDFIFYEAAGRTPTLPKSTIPQPIAWQTSSSDTAASRTDASILSDPGTTSYPEVSTSDHTAPILK